MMKIVYLIAGTYNSGGMERVLANKANWWVRHGHDVSVITSDQRGRPTCFPMDASIRHYDLGINYEETNGRSFLRKAVAFPLKQWRHKRRLSQLLQRLKADVTVCMFNNDVSFAYKIQDGSLKVLEAHFSKHKKLQYARQGLWALADRWRTRQEERIVRKYDRFVVLTHEDKMLWGNLPNIWVIPNAHTFDPKGQAELRQKRVLAVGRYDHQKGFDTLINIWRKIGPEREGWTLDIYGNGPLRSALQQQVERLGLTESVRLLMPTDKIEDVYLSSAVLVMTSLYEGLPMVLLEAQACGLPIVAFACQCGPRDVIHDGTDGFLIEGRNETLFAQRLEELMQDFTLRQRMGADAFKASERYSEEQVMQEWEKIFNR